MHFSTQNGVMTRWFAMDVAWSMLKWAERHETSYIHGTIFLNDSCLECMYAWSRIFPRNYITRVGSMRKFLFFFIFLTFFDWFQIWLKFIFSYICTRGMQNSCLGIVWGTTLVVYLQVFSENIMNYNLCTYNLNLKLIGYISLYRYCLMEYVYLMNCNLFASSYLIFGSYFIKLQLFKIFFGCIQICWHFQLFGTTSVSRNKAHAYFKTNFDHKNW
jgi:hypothetical protein